MWRKWLLLAGLAATFGGLALHYRNAGHSATTSAVATAGGSGATAPAHNHSGSATTGDGGLGMMNGLDLKVTSSPTAGTGVPLAFQIVQGSAPHTKFGEVHTKMLHLIVVRSDLTGFQHVHPTMDATGTWTAPVDLTPGTWRVVADGSPLLMGGMAMPTVLGAQFTVPGTPTGLQTQFPVSDTVVVDGYTVKGSGELGVGHPHNYTLTVTKDGAPVTDISEYLGAYGHLVAFDTVTLTYTHLHPGREVTPGQSVGPTVVFQSQLPKDGRYKLFFEFIAGGVHHVAPLTANVME